jgi:hypothetical protein
MNESIHLLKDTEGNTSIMTDTECNALLKDGLIYGPIDEAYYVKTYSLEDKITWNKIYESLLTNR